MYRLLFSRHLQDTTARLEEVTTLFHAESGDRLSSYPSSFVIDCEIVAVSLSGGDQGGIEPKGSPRHAASVAAARVRATGTTLAVPVTLPQHIVARTDCCQNATLKTCFRIEVL